MKAWSRAVMWQFRGCDTLPPDGVLQAAYCLYDLSHCPCFLSLQCPHLYNEIGACSVP